MDGRASGGIRRGRAGIVWGEVNAGLVRLADYLASRYRRRGEDNAYD